MSQVLDDKLRTEIYQKVTCRPRFYLWVAFNISRKSSQMEVQELFEKCARDTGCNAAKMAEVAAAFVRSDGLIPEYVLQCCSAKLTRRWQ